MNKISRLLIVSLAAVSLMSATASADSFGFHFGDDGFGIDINIGDYDYYDRYSPDFYESDGLDFRAALTPYGSWTFDMELGGNVWIPTVPFGWRPYSNGSWNYTQYGWTWVAYEPWGWIPHHYGNWINHQYYGWVWVPGYTWSPANVTWGYFNGYYGWAPLPPRHCNYYNHYRRPGSSHHWYSHRNYYRNPFVVRDRNTYSYNDDAYYRSIPNQAWVMVDNRNFTSGNIADVALDPNRASAVFENAKFEILDRAPRKQIIERHCGKTINRTRVDEVVKNVNGHQVKLVRPVNVLESHANQVRKVHKNFIRSNVSKPVKNHSGSIAKPGSSARNHHQTVARPRVPSVNHQKPIVKPGNHHQSIAKPRAPVNNRQPHNPVVNRNKTINRPSRNHHVNKPAAPKTIRRPAPPKTIRRPAPPKATRRPAPARAVKKSKKLDDEEDKKQKKGLRK